MTFHPQTPTCRGLFTASMDPADKPRDGGIKVKCQQNLMYAEVIENRPVLAQASEMPITPFRAYHIRLCTFPDLSYYDEPVKLQFFGNLSQELCF